MAHSFASIVRDSERARWSLEDVTAGLHDLDFGQPFLPDDLVHVSDLHFLGPMEQRWANQIRAHSYLQLFALVERFILPFVISQAGNALHESSDKLLALLQFSEEEAKHIRLFERFSEAFEFGFGSVCEMIGPADEIVGSVLGEDPLAVALLVMHIEWMTQDHYLRSARDAQGIDPQFKRLLRCHWVEEAQHARLDMLLVEELLSQYDEAGRRRALDAYIGMLSRLAGVMANQVELDIEAYVRAGGTLDGKQRDAWRNVQVTAYHEAFLRAGITHPKLRKTTDACVPDSAAVLDAAAASWAMPG